MPKKCKSITFQLSDPWERDLYEYAHQMHNFSGTIKRIISSSPGFEVWQEKRHRRDIQVITPRGTGIIKLDLTKEA